MSDATKIYETTQKVIDNMLLTADGSILTQDDFKLPTDMDFLAENFSVDLYNKFKDTNLDYPMYLETPFTLTPGYYEEERVFIVKAVPLVEDFVKRKLGPNERALHLSNMNKELYQDDGDTVYFLNETLFTGNSSFTLGDIAYESLDEFLSIQENSNGKFGVRFLGINTPEIPHYTSTPYLKENLHIMKYGDIKNKSNIVVLDHKDFEDRKDSDEITLFYDQENNKYYEVINDKFKEAYNNIPLEEQTTLDNLGGYIAKILYIDESEKNKVKKGIEAAETVRSMIGKAEDLVIMLDHQSLSRQSNHYQSPYEQDYFSYGYAHGMSPWKTISNYWGRFFSDARYKYLGFNSWGQDNNKRMLGTIYIKVKLDDIGPEAVWINLTKYILQNFSKDVVALPDYTSDPKENMHNGFVSDAFKLWTYDFKNQIVLDAFTTYTDKYIEERDRVFEELAGMDMKSIKEYSMILGDNVFIVPPTSIRCITQTQTERVQLLRSRGSATKQAPASEKIIELKLYFNNEEGINGEPYEVTLPNGQKTTYWMNGLRSLIAQFKLTPFLPIENNYINSVLNVFGVTLMDLNISTMPGFPKCLQVTLTLQEFNYHTYMPELPLPDLMNAEDLNINMFARCIHYPVMRWYYQRLLHKGEKIKNLEFNSPEYIKETFGSNTALVPMNFEDSKIDFYLPEKDHLNRRLQAALEKEARPIRPYYPITDNGKELFRKMAPIANRMLASSFEEKTKTLAKDISAPYSVDYTGVTSYGGHVRFDLETNKLITDESGSAKMFYEHVCKLFALPNNKDDGFVNYNYEELTCLRKADFSHEMDRLSFDYALLHNSPIGQGIDGVKTTGNPYTAQPLKNYFGVYSDSMFLHGSCDFKESLKYDSNSKESKIIITAYIPMPQILESEIERDEFMKMVITNLGVNSYDDIFSYNESGALSVKVDFYIPSITYLVTLPDSYMQDPILIANGDIAIDTECPGFIFLKFCEKNVKKVELDEGGYEFLDYTGDAMIGGATPEAQELNKQNYLESEDSIPFAKFDFGEEINIEKISCVYSNSLARVKLNAMDGYAHQFCGGQDSIIEVSLTTKNEAVASLLQALPRLAASFVIDYKEILPCWPLRIKSEITKLFGINEVLIETVDLSTVPNFPGLYSINMRMVSVDRSTRNRETLKRLEGVNNSGSIANGSKGEYTNKNYFDLKRVLGKAEIYPDLELPTVDELEYAGYKLIKYYNPNENTRKFLDPDFYFIYAHILTHELLNAGIQKGFSTAEYKMDINLTDKFGSKYLLTEDQTEEELKAELPLAARPLNDAAKSMEAKSSQAYSSAKIASVQDIMNKKGFNDLNQKHKLSSKLTESIAGLKTPIWSLTNEHIFPLREEQFKMVYRKDYKDKPEQIYLEQIKNYEDGMFEVINAELAREIDLEVLDLKNLTEKDLDHTTFFDGNSMVSWAENRIKTFNSKYNTHRTFLLKLAHSTTELVIDRGENFNNYIDNILLAFADTSTGFAFCENKKNFMTDISRTEGDKYSEINWKLKPFINYGQSVFTPEKNIDWSKVSPYVKVKNNKNPEQTFAYNIDDALINGYTFGVFQVAMYPKESIAYLITNEDEKKHLMESDIEFVFLDPYYRALQLKDPKGEEIKKYKRQLILDPAFCAYAYIRNLMVWYNYLLKEEIALSLYETIKASVTTNVYKEYSQESGGQAFVGSIDEDREERETNKVYEENFKKHAEAFATAFCVAFNTSSNSELVEPEELLELSVPEELHSYVKDKKNASSQDIQSLIDSLKEERAAAEADIDKQNIDLMLKILGYDSETQTSFDVTQEDIVRYGNQITIQLRNQKEQNRINSQTYSEIFDQLKTDKKFIITGKMIGLSMLLIKNGGSILSAMRNRETYELDSLMMSLPMPTVNGENNDLRKYVLALDGRDVVKLEYVGNSTQTAEELVKIAASQSIFIQKCNDIRAYLRDSYLDMIKNDKRGRMIRAFPTYYMLFIDEGREIGLWKLHDNFYNMNAISEITVTKSRKIAADTAQIVMSNMFKTFSSDDSQRDYETSEINSIRYNMRDAFNSIFSPRVYAMKEEQKRQMQEVPRTAQIKPGVRIHLRMGYSSNAADLPILFNGNIAEVGASNIVDIVAQGDGAELLNPINDIDDASDVENKEKFFVNKWVTNWLTNGATPKQIMTALLTTRGSWLQELAREWSSGRFFNRNPYGIVHFGDQEFKDVFVGGEVIQNIYEANARATYGTHEKYTGLESNYDTSQTPVISMHLLGKTFWDVMHVCSSVQPDFIASIVPFGMRSSIFYGAPRFYYAYDYDLETLDNGGKMVKEKRKPFQQYHIYTSFTDIIHNNVRASGKEIKTNAIGLYQEKQMFGEKVKQVGPLFVDFDIYPEFQKSMTVDTQLWAQGMPVVGNMFGWTADLSKDVSNTGFNPIPGAKEIAWRMTASALKNSMRDMYVGELTVIGDPSVKPYDRMIISDVYERMDGQCEVEAVVHTLNTVTGFTTSIYADCISVVDDAYEQYANLHNMKVAGYCVASATANMIGMMFNRSGRPIVTSMLKMATKPVGTATNLIKNIGSFLGSDDLKLVENLIKSNDYLLKLTGMQVESTFVAALNSSLKSSTSGLLAFKGLDITDSIQVDEYFRHLQNTIDELDNSSARKEIFKQSTTGKNQDLGKQALKEYDDVVKLKKADIVRYTKPDVDLEYALYKMTTNSNIDEVSKATFNAFMTNPDFLADSKNIASLRTAITTTATLGDDAVDLAKAMTAITKNSDDIAKVALSFTDDLLGKAGIKTIMKFGSDAKAFATVAATGFWPALILMVIEMAISALVAGYSSEFIYRYLQNLEVLKIYPLKRKSRVMVAGIDGHKGVVVGSPTYEQQGDWTNFMISMFDGEKGGFIKSTVQFFLGTEQINEVAKRLRRNNNIPEPQGDLDSSLTAEAIKDSIAREINSIYTNNAKYSSREIMRYERIPNLTSEYIDYLKENIISADFLNSPKGSSLAMNTIPIQEDEEIKQYLDKNFADIFTISTLGSKEMITVNFNGKNVAMECYKHSDGKWIVPSLRRDAMLLLKDCLRTLFEDSDAASYSTEEIKLPYVFITSATVIGGIANWENTGYGFRLQLDSSRYSKEDVEKFCIKMTESYNALGYTNYMQCSPYPYNKQEAIFIVKPIKSLD